MKPRGSALTVVVLVLWNPFAQLDLVEACLTGRYGPYHNWPSSHDWDELLWLLAGKFGKSGLGWHGSNGGSGNVGGGGYNNFGGFSGNGGNFGGIRGPSFSPDSEPQNFHTPSSGTNSAFNSNKMKLALSNYFKSKNKPTASKKPITYVGEDPGSYYDAPPPGLPPSYYSSHSPNYDSTSSWARPGPQGPSYDDEWPSYDKNQSPGNLPRENGLSSTFNGDGPPTTFGDGGPQHSFREEGPPNTYREEGPPSYREEGPPNTYREEGPPNTYREEGPPSYREEGPPNTHREKRPSNTYPESGPPYQSDYYDSHNLRRQGRSRRVLPGLKRRRRPLSSMRRHLKTAMSFYKRSNRTLRMNHRQAMAKKKMDTSFGGYKVDHNRLSL